MPISNAPNAKPGPKKAIHKARTRNSSLRSSPRPPAASKSRIVRSKQSKKMSSSTAVEFHAREILSSLLSSNQTYLSGQSVPKSLISSPVVRKDLADNGQHPVAAVVACADSRVAPEIVFGLGLGKLFTVRNAGNVGFEDSVIGSLEYAVEHLKVELVVVLGHTQCGAVGAAVGANGLKGGLGRHVQRIKERLAGVDNVVEGVEKNVRVGVESLREELGDGCLVVGAVYDIESGEVKEIDC